MKCLKPCDHCAQIGRFPAKVVQRGLNTYAALTLWPGRDPLELFIGPDPEEISRFLRQHGAEFVIREDQC